MVAGAACVEPVTPARTFDDYEHKAKDTAESALSSVQTARLGSRVPLAVMRSGRTFGAPLGGRDGAAQRRRVFDSVQPPDDHADRLRAALDALLNRSDGPPSRAAHRGRVEASSIGFGDWHEPLGSDLPTSSTGSSRAHE